MKKVLICGAGGFIGSHLAKRLSKEGNFVIGADLKYPDFSNSHCDDFYITDLRDPAQVSKIFSEDIDEVYQLAADMGGADYIFTGLKDADITSNSILINVNILKEMVKHKVSSVFYASSACVYAEDNQLDSSNPICTEESAYPACPDSEYGWEKLFSERLYMNYAKNYDLRVRIARFHNVFGPEGTWQGGKEKAPAALCRKIIMSNGTPIDVYGTGNQTRSFLYIDEAIEGIVKIMNSDYSKPLNLGSERLISINDLARLIASINLGREVEINNISGPSGVAGRVSDNNLLRKSTNWSPAENLEEGLEKTYEWISKQVSKIS